ncbi:protein of unknown function [Candidatus Nitrosocosmicus franklandus]|uniref:Uncharacterized protein n=1 Tax=Candidatus Nitrosocosmicus franklandianus TaxID=1798806 RepID=A0A484I9Y6_9ARCH|nr:protein of unknown function [Candidatus Nitrosocosmicus franklandus]
MYSKDNVLKYLFKCVINLLLIQGITIICLPRWISGYKSYSYLDGYDIHNLATLVICIRSMYKGN